MIWIFLACSEPESFADCAGLRDAVERAGCRVDFARAVGSDREALQALLDSVDDPVERDVLIVDLAVEDPHEAGRLCEQVQTPSGRRRCESVLGRPHLGVRKKDP